MSNASASSVALLSLRASAAALAASASRPQPSRDSTCIESSDALLSMISCVGDIVAADRPIASSAIIDAVTAVAVAGVNNIGVAALKRLITATITYTGVTALPMHCVDKLATAAKSESYKQRDLVALNSQLIVLATIIDGDPSVVKGNDNLSGKNGPTGWLPNPTKTKDASTRIACGLLVGALSASTDPTAPVSYEHAKYVSKLWATAAKEPLVREALVPVLLRTVRPRAWSPMLRHAAMDSYTAPIVTALAEEVLAASHTAHMAGAAGAFVASALAASSPSDAGQLSSLIKLGITAASPSPDQLDHNSFDVAAALVAEALLIYASSSIGAVSGAIAVVASRLAAAATVGDGKASRALPHSLLMHRLSVVRQGLRLWSVALPCDAIRCQAAEAVLSTADGGGSLVAAWTSLATGRSLLSVLDPPTENTILAAWGAALRVYNGAQRQLPSAASSPAPTAHLDALLGQLDAVQNEAVELLAVLLLSQSHGPLIVKMLEAVRQGVGIELVSRAIIIARQASVKFHSQNTMSILDAIARDTIECGWKDSESPIERALLCAVACSSSPSTATVELRAAATSVVASLEFPQEQTVCRATLTAVSAAAAAVLATTQDPSSESVLALSSTAVLLLRWSIRSLSGAGKSKAVPPHSAISGRRLGLLLWESVARLPRSSGAARYDDAIVSLLGTILKDSLVFGEVVTLRPPGVGATDVSSLLGDRTLTRYPFLGSASLVERLVPIRSSRKRADTFSMTMADLSIAAIAATFATGDYATRKKILVVLFDVLAELDAAVNANRTVTKHAICTTVWMCLVAARKFGRATAKQSELAGTLLQQLTTLFLPTDSMATKMVAAAALCELTALSKMSDVEVMSPLMNPKAGLTPDCIIAASAWITRVRGVTHSYEGTVIARQLIAQFVASLDWTKSCGAALNGLITCSATVSAPGVIAAFTAAAASSSCCFFAPSVQLAACAMGLNAARIASTEPSPAQSPTGASHANHVTSATINALISSGASVLVTHSLHCRYLSTVTWMRQPSGENQLGVEAMRVHPPMLDLCGTGGAARCPAVIRARLLPELAALIPYQPTLAFLSRLPASTARSCMPARLLLPLHVQPHLIIAAMQNVQQSRPEVLPAVADPGSMSLPSSSSSVSTSVVGTTESRASRMDAAAADGGDGPQASAGLSAAVNRVGGGNRAVYAIEASTKALVLHRVAELLEEGSFSDWPVKARADLAACVAAAGSFLGSESSLGAEFASALRAVFRAWGNSQTPEGPLLFDLQVHLTTAVRAVVSDVNVPISDIVPLVEIVSTSNISSDDASIARLVKAVSDALDSRLALPTSVLHGDACAVWQSMTGLGARLPLAHLKSRAAIAAFFHTSNKVMVMCTSPTALHLIPETLVTAMSPWCAGANRAFRTVLATAAIKNSFDASRTATLQLETADLIASNEATLHAACVAASRGLSAAAAVSETLVHNATGLLLAACAVTDTSRSGANSITGKCFIELVKLVTTHSATVPTSVAQAVFEATPRFTKDTAMTLSIIKAVLTATPFAVDCVLLWTATTRLVESFIRLQPTDLVMGIATGLVAASAVPPHCSLPVAALALALLWVPSAEHAASSACSHRMALVYQCVRRLARVSATATESLLFALGKWLQDADLTLHVAIAATAAVLEGRQETGTVSTDGLAVCCVRLTTKAAVVCHTDADRGAALNLLPPLGALSSNLRAQSAVAFGAIVSNNPQAIKGALESLSPVARDQLRALANSASVQTASSTVGPSHGAAAVVDAPLKLNLSAYR